MMDIIAAYVEKFLYSLICVFSITTVETKLLPIEMRLLVLKKSFHISQ